MATSRFEKFYDDVRSGTFDEYKELFWHAHSRADGVFSPSHPPTKKELRRMLGLDEGGDPRWRERLSESLRAKVRWAVQHGCFENPYG